MAPRPAPVMHRVNRPGSVLNPTGMADTNDRTNLLGEGERTTPMMAQYLEVKRAYPDCLLFYRMGDFYEMFFADAESAAKALDITLTKRGRHLDQDIPMCGVPVHAAEA
jgi:hypothetical protein